jgi:histidine ammonia-lyase
MQSIVIDKENLTIEDVVAIARQDVRVNASSQGEQRVEKARESE